MQTSLPNQLNVSALVDAFKSISCVSPVCLQFGWVVSVCDLLLLVACIVFSCLASANYNTYSLQQQLLQGASGSSSPRPSPAAPGGNNDPEVYTQAFYLIPRIIAIVTGGYLSFFRLARLPVGFIHPTATWRISRLAVTLSQLVIGACSHLDKETDSRPVAWMLLGSIIVALAASLALFLLDVYITYVLSWSLLYRLMYFGIAFIVAWGLVFNRWLTIFVKVQWNKYKNFFFGSQASTEHLKLYGDLEILDHTLQILEFVDACGFLWLRPFSEAWCARVVADRKGTYPCRPEPPVEVNDPERGRVGSQRIVDSAGCV